MSGPAWLETTRLERRDQGEPDVFADCAPSSVQVLTLFVTGGKTDRVKTTRERLNDGSLDVGDAVARACSDMPAYRHVTVGMLALEGGRADSRVKATSLRSTMKWPRTVYALAELDTLVVIARRSPRVCLTRKALLGSTRRRRTRRMRREVAAN
jgi:hypothetical protein